MLTYILALVVGLGSFALYMTAFFFPELHRKGDFIWSGIGMFYALVLWVCAGRITGGVLLGQIASVALLGWFAWQTLILRRALTPLEQRTAMPATTDLQESLKSVTRSESLSRLSSQVTRQVTNVKDWTQAALTTLNKPAPKPPVETPRPYVPAPPTKFSTTSSTVKPAIDQERKADEAPSKAILQNEDIWLDESEDSQPEQVVNGVSNAAGGVPEAEIAAKATEAGTAASTTSAMKQTANSLGSIANRLQTTLKSLTTRQSKPVYVRKAYRDEEKPATEPPTSAGTAELVEDSLMPADAAIEAEIEFEEQQSSTETGTSIPSITESAEADLDDIDLEPNVEAIVDAPALSTASEEQPSDVGAIDADLDDLNATAAVDSVSAESALLNPDVTQMDASNPGEESDPDVTEILHTQSPAKASESVPASEVNSDGLATADGGSEQTTEPKSENSDHS
jgi:hypothetical protein